MIRSMTEEDGKRVLEIYAQGIRTGNATFETQVPGWDEWDKKHLQHSRFVFRNGNDAVGWAALSPVSAREVYRGVAEVSVYVDPEFGGRGIATALMHAMIESSERNGIWTLFASIFPENTASIRLHEKCGFRRIGTREKIAMLNGVWRDTAIFERRSSIVGV